MSGIVLSASVRQNLLSLQSTAALLATTQNDLATGNKVNSALDNPTEYFTAQNLNNRASDISNLLDGINNGVQVLQAANTGITSLQGYIATAQSIANQVLQAPTGYSTKSSVTSAALTGATSENLLGTDSAATINEGNFTNINVSGLGNATAGKISAAAFSGPLDLSGTGASISFSVSVDGATAQTVSLTATEVTTFNTNTGSTLSDSDLSAADVANLVNYELAGNTGSTVPTSGPASVVGGNLQFASSTTGTSSSIAITSFASAGTITGSTGIANASETGTDGSTAGTATAAAFSGTLDLSGTGASITFDLALDGAASPTTITLDASQVTAFSTAGGTLDTGDSLSQLDATDVANIINWEYAGSASSGVTSPVSGPASVVNGNLVFTSTTTGASSSVAVTNYATAGTVTDNSGLATVTSTAGVAAQGPDKLSFTIKADGATTATTVNISAAEVTAYNAANPTATQLDDTKLSASDVASLINYQLGSNIASATPDGDLTFTSTTTGPTSSLTVTAQTGTATAGATGITAGTNTGSSGSGLSGETLTIAATNSESKATVITFGTGAGQVATLNDLNTQLAANDLQASIDSATGALTITTTNNAASDKVGAIGGTAAQTGGAFAADTAGGAAPVEDPDSQATRSSLISQYNQVMQQITTTAQDSSYNGINLLNGDTLNLTFDESGQSKLAITGVVFNAAGLGLNTLKAGTDFLDSDSANDVLTALNNASTTLSAEASALGSNLSVVQNREDFNKNLINVLQTGASNLTLADPNEEAANSQALSTRQSIAVSALALANTSQQSVLQLLR